MPHHHIPKLLWTPNGIDVLERVVDVQNYLLQPTHHLFRRHRRMYFGTEDSCRKGKSHLGSWFACSWKFRARIYGSTFAHMHMHEPILEYAKFQGRSRCQKPPQYSFAERLDLRSRLLGAIQRWVGWYTGKSRRGSGLSVTSGSSFC